MPSAPAHAEVRPASPDEDQPAPPRPPEGSSSGPWLTYAARPPPRAAETTACSLRLPLCVHGEEARPRAPGVLHVLASAERAWDVLTGPLKLPSPDVSPDTLTYDIFLSDDVSPAEDLAVTRLEARDVRSRIDRARAFTMIDARARAGCALDAAMARALARASLYRVAPAMAEGIARAQIGALAHLAVPCAIAYDAEAAATFQERPERTVCDLHAGAPHPSATEPHGPSDRVSALFSRGASLWWSRIDWAYARRPGAILLGTWYLAPTMTELGAARWNDEPDAFDVLRKSFEGALFTGSKLADLALDSAVARAFMGSADDGLHHPETRTLGDAARVRLDWDLPWPNTPRRIAPRLPVHPLGASYVLVRLTGRKEHARLRVEIAWEEHSLFRWALVKIDSGGRELGRVVVPSRERATEAQMTFVDLEGADRVLLVGVNAGDPAYRFDPDEEVWEPHGWLVTLAEQ
jgi:hypothetical protein